MNVMVAEVYRLCTQASFLLHFKAVFVLVFIFFKSVKFYIVRVASFAN